MMYRRQGECNLCGECCMDHPWGGKEVWSNRGKSVADFTEGWPFITLFGGVSAHRIKSPSQRTRELRPRKEKGQVKLTNGNTCHYIWIDGGVWRDLEPYGDEETVDAACPFLLPMVDDQRPCALMGSSKEELWHKYCESQPPEIKNEWAVEDWKKLHPSCSYTWEPVDE